MLIQIADSVIDMEAKAHWIFYLRLQRDLPREYFLVDQKFKNNFKSLVPITIRGLSESVKSSKRVHVLIVIKTMDEYRYFNKHVKKIMKFLVRTGKVHLYIASSFNGVNDTAIMRRDHYNFMKLPVTFEHLCESVSQMIDTKELSSHQWPGGIRSKFKLTG